MKRLVCSAAAMLILAVPLAVRAEWPEQPIKIIVPFPAGNSSDISMRLLGEKLSTRLRQPVIIDNKVGAGGAIGTGQAAKAAPDGYTLAMGSTGPLVVARALRPNSLPYDAARDFTAVSAVAWAPQVLTVRKDFPASNVREFLAYGRKPGTKLNYASGGNGTSNHLVLAQLVSQTKINAEHIPYQGGVQALTGLIGGQIDFLSYDLPVIRGALDAGQVKALGVTAGTRIPSMPNLPTLKEQGVDDFDYQGWILLVAPKGVPEAIIDKLNTAVVAILKMPDLRQRLLDLGLVPMDVPRAQLAGFLKSEEAKWARLVQVSGAAETTR